MIESNGSTSVTDAGNRYLLLTSAGFVTLKYANVDVTLGQFAGWTLIGAEQIAGGGYEVAWKTAGANPQYTVWNTDSSGNYVSNIGVVSANSTALESLEPSFQQDLNGDLTIGLTTSVIETFGSTKLVQMPTSISCMRSADRRGRR
jgi:serralysin